MRNFYPKTGRVITSKDVIIDVNYTYRTDFDKDHNCVIRENMEAG